MLVHVVARPMEAVVLAWDVPGSTHLAMSLGAGPHPGAPWVLVTPTPPAWLPTATQGLQVLEGDGRLLPWPVGTGTLEAVDLGELLVGAAETELRTVAEEVARVLRSEGSVTLRIDPVVCSHDRAVAALAEGGVEVTRSLDGERPGLLEMAGRVG